MLYALIPLYYYTELNSRYSEANVLEFVVLIIFFFGVSACFAFSTLFVYQNMGLSRSPFG